MVTWQRIAVVALAGAATACVTACAPTGWRPARGSCAFGAETAQQAAWCAEVNFGADGLLAIALAVNEDVLAKASGRPLPCTEHVARVRMRLAAYPDYRVRELYSCDAEPVHEGGRPVCHVSVLVTGAAGARVVIDNGHVLEPRTTGGVAEFAEFTALVDRHWLGEPPASVAAPSP